MEGSNLGSLDTLVQERLDADTEFLTSIEALDEAERESAVATKRTEILDAEFARLKKQEELANNYKTRAEKAEQAIKEKKPSEQVKKSDDDLSVKDSYALLKADVPIEDVDEVKEAAKVLKISIQDAVNNPIVKARLAELKSFRETENATNVRPARAATKQVSDEELIAQANKGNIPKPGSEEAARLWRARRQQRN